DGKDLQTDHCGRPVHVLTQLVEVFVGDDVQVHAHGSHERGEISGGQLVAVDRVCQGPKHRFARFLARKSAPQVDVDLVQAGSLRVHGRVRGGFVDDVVHPTCETVEGVDGGTAFGRQDPG